MLNFFKKKAVTIGALSTLVLSLVVSSFALDLGKNNNLILGDVDLDGEITASDARITLRQAVGLENYAEDSNEFKAMDYDQDKVVTAADARLVLRAAVGLEEIVILDNDDISTTEEEGTIEDEPVITEPTTEEEEESGYSPEGTWLPAIGEDNGPPAPPFEEPPEIPTEPPKVIIHDTPQTFDDNYPTVNVTEETTRNNNFYLNGIKYKIPEGAEVDHYDDRYVYYTDGQKEMRKDEPTTEYICETTTAEPIPETTTHETINEDWCTEPNCAEHDFYNPDYDNTKGDGITTCKHCGKPKGYGAGKCTGRCLFDGICEECGKPYYMNKCHECIPVF